jgi:ADP-ribosylglycohydrolase
MERKERYRGSLLGLAAGDAVGTTLEFRSPGSFTPINDIQGGGPFNLQTGEWTDDTSIALCLAARFMNWPDENNSWPVTTARASTPWHQ